MVDIPFRKSSEFPRAGAVGRAVAAAAAGDQMSRSAPDANPLTNQGSPAGASPLLETPSSWPTVEEARGELNLESSLCSEGFLLQKFMDSALGTRRWWWSNDFCHDKFIL